MSYATVIDSVQKNSTFIQDLKTNITDFARNMTIASGRVITTAAAQGSSVARVILDKSPIGVIVAGVLLAAVNVKMAHKEWHRTSDEYDRRRMFAHMAVGLAGVGVAAYTAAKVYGFTLGTGSAAPVMVDLREENVSAVANATNATVANISAAVIPEAPLPAPASFFDNRTMSALNGYFVDDGICSPAVELPVQPEQFFIPTPIPVPEAPGMLDPVTSLYSWLRGKVKGT